MISRISSHRPSRARISRFTTSDFGASFGSELVILEVDQPYDNHNGGQIHFDHDGYLMLGYGDGGSANDPLNAGQNMNTLLGSFIRIDVFNQSAMSLSVIVAAKWSSPLTQISPRMSSSELDELPIVIMSFHVPASIWVALPAPVA